MDQSNREELSARRYIALLLALGSGLFVTCADAVDARENGASEAREGLVGAEAGEFEAFVPCAGGVVVSGDRAVCRSVSLGQPTRVRCGVYGLLEVRLPVKNVTTRTLRFGVQFEFLDADRVAYGDRTTRQVVSLVPGQSHVFVGRSARERAAAFTIRLAGM